MSADTKELTSVRASQPRDPRRRMLDAAAELFARQGYHAASIRDLARGLDLTVGALYAHFPSKERLLAGVYAEGVSRIAAAVDHTTTVGGDSWTRLERACAAHLAMILASDGYARVLTRVLPSDVPAIAGELVAMRDGYEARFRDLIAGLDLPAGTDRRLVRLLLLGALNWTHAWYREQRAAPSAASADAIARQLVALIEPKRTSAQAKAPGRAR